MTTVNAEVQCLGAAPRKVFINHKSWSVECDGDDEVGRSAELPTSRY